MTMTLSEIITVLKDAGLFKELIVAGKWHDRAPEELANRTVLDLSYDSRTVKERTLFFCKGLKFDPKYLTMAANQGASVAMAPADYSAQLKTSEHPDLPQVIVTDIQKAMATVSRAFFGFPDRNLTVIGYTGTKGKTTSVYFTRHVMAKALGKVVAQLSSIDECLDGETFIPAHLTTPESLDLFRMMKEAVDNQMKYLVMEVSSQSYKKSRVFGLPLDIGVFLNISPDHISPVEHPSFEDYLACKSEIIDNCRILVVNRECSQYDYLAEKAHDLGKQVISFGSDQSAADYQYRLGEHGYFTVTTANPALPKLDGDFRVMMPGDFNVANALAALTVAAQVAPVSEDFRAGLAETTVPGRMEFIKDKQGVVACVDYAHNYLSLTASFNFMKHEFKDGRLIVVIGAAGGKAESRRKDIGRALSQYADVAILTSEDNFFEDPHQIAADIKENIDNPDLEVIVNVDRKAAIEQAYAMAKPGDALFMAAKGRETFMHEKGKDVPYQGDYQITKQLMEK